VGWDHLAVDEDHLGLLLAFFVVSGFSQHLSLNSDWVDELETTIVFALIRVNTFEFGAWLNLGLKSLCFLAELVDH